MCNSRSISSASELVQAVPVPVWDDILRRRTREYRCTQLNLLSRPSSMGFPIIPIRFKVSIQYILVHCYIHFSIRLLIYCSSTCQIEA
ncbi:hypothetical protein ANCCAN_24066 [Ancylostoma caninum]|uniref:Uncharacterized protein n=1 Tax=Ancylostoma caninum TaxID=29170 RepID=A0A368FGQ0_ANCCA|nr:hypothetical protein ANCCAN_24066 [Ancylostoma caninum]